ncbi:MAG: HAD-IA family hydrolase, partial [Lachnospiraceae bacterium]|nr:HAD-IA family hydrolase [Lachnospiraceae bacterium]
MIRNIIFDMGQVLIRFNTEVFLDRFASDYTTEERTLLLREVYRSAEWIMQDRGTHTPEQTVEIVCRNLPEKLHEAVYNLVCRWNEDIIPVEGMKELVEELKGKGYGIYLLSNAARDLPDYWERIPGHEYFDNLCVSAFHGFIKPQPELYRCALQKFNVAPEECVFIDDVT